MASLLLAFVIALLALGFGWWVREPHKKVDKALVDVLSHRHG